MAFRLRPRFWWVWIFYAVGGTMGFWYASVGSRSVLFLIPAIGLASIPFIVVHELGHLLAGRAMGLRVYEFSIGEGRLVWEKRVGQLDVRLHEIPFCGYVRHLPGANDSRLASIVYVAGGPLSNLLSAGVLFLLNGAEVASFSRARPLDILIIANLFLFLGSMFPTRFCVAGEWVYSDGWQLIFLLRGSTPLDDSTASTGVSQPVAKRATALEELRRVAERMRNHEVKSAILIIIGWALFAGVILRLIWDQDEGGIVAAGFGIVALILVLSALRIGLRDPLPALTAHHRASVNPMRTIMQEVGAEYGAMLGATAFSALPEETRLAFVRLRPSPSDKKVIHDVIAQLPDVPLMQAFLLDSFYNEGRYAEAAEAARHALSTPDLPPLSRAFLETQYLAAALAAGPSESLRTRCQDAIDELQEEGSKMLRIALLTTMVLRADLRDFLRSALAWSQQALAIFPYDPSSLQCVSLVYIELGQTAEAEKWLKKLRLESTSESDFAILETLQALLAAAQNKPHASRLLARCQSELAPEWLRTKANKIVSVTSASDS